MARWDDEYRAHAVHAILDQLIEKLTTADGPTAPSSIDELERVHYIVDLLVGVMADAEPSLMRDLPGTLNAIQQQATAITAQLDQYRSDGNAGHISQAIPLAEALLAQVPQLQVARPHPEGAVGEAATRYRQRVGQYTSRLGEEADAVSSDIKQISGEAGALRANLDQLHATVNQKLGEWESAFTTAETGRRSEFDALTSAERDKARQDFATELNALSATYEKLYDKLASQQAAQAESLTSLDLSWNERVEALEVEASELTESLEGYKAQARGPCWKDR